MEATMSENIKSEIADGVMTLTLQRPEKKNALTGAMYDALSDALQRAIPSGPSRPKMRPNTNG
jgi:enoyl-CoA hydratase/carnithine racemase